MDEALMASEIERRLQQTQATLAAFPHSRRMEYLRLLVEEHQRLAGKSAHERIQHLRVLMQAIDAAEQARRASTGGARLDTGLSSQSSAT